MVTDLGGASDIGGRRSIKSGIAGMGGAMSKSLSKMGLSKRQAAVQEAQAGDIPVDATGVEAPAVDMIAPDQVALEEALAAESAAQIPVAPTAQTGIPGLTQGGANTTKGMQGMFGQTKNPPVQGVKPPQDADPMKMIFGSNSPASKPAIIAGNAMVGHESTSLAPLQTVIGQNPVAAVPKASKFDKQVAIKALFGGKHNPAVDDKEIETLKSNPLKLIAGPQNIEQPIHSKEDQKKALSGLFKGVEIKE